MRKRIVGLGLLSILSVVSGLTVSAQPPQLMIIEVLVNDPVDGEITINGMNFDNGNDLMVTIGGFANALVIFPMLPNQIIAVLPAGILPGSYVLVVSSGARNRQIDDIDLAIPGDPGDPPGGTVDFFDLLNRPDGLDDGDDVGILVEVDPFVRPELLDGVDWVDVAGIPGDIADGDDGQLGLILDYGSSNVTSTVVPQAALHIAYGHVSVAGLAIVTISNLPFTDVSTYSASGSYNIDNPNVVARVQIQRANGSQMNITNTHPDTRVINWIAVGR